MAESDRTIFKDEVVHIAKLVRDGKPLLKNFQFTNCYIKGPAVLLSIGETEWTDCTFPQGLEVLIEVPELKMLFGCIGVEDCIFRKCTFMDVGLIGPDTFVSEFKLHWGE